MDETSGIRAPSRDGLWTVNVVQKKSMVSGYRVVTDRVRKGGVEI